MIRLLLEPVNLLILDEPTNHLDMNTKDILKQAIKDFNGTVIVVSHDREFLDGLVEKVYEFGGGQVKECLGGIYEFLEKKKLASLTELERNKPAAPAQPQVASTPKQPTKEIELPSRKLSYAEQREQTKMLRKAEKKVAETEADIAAIEAEIKATEARIAAGDVDNEIFEKHAALQKKQENAMSLWELATMELEELKEKLS